MKRKLFVFLAALLVFILLFYNREPGLNVFIFCLAAWLLTGKSMDGFKDYRSDRGFWALSLAMGVTAGAYTFYGDAGSMFCVFLSTYVLGIYLTDRRFHIILYPLLLAYSFGTFIVRIFFIERWLPVHSWMPPAANPAAPAAKRRYIAWIRVWLLPVLIAVTFLIIYMFSSTMFADILTRLLPRLDFKMIFILAILGFFLLFNFMYLLPIPWLYTANERVIGWDRGRNTINTDGRQDHPLNAAHQKGAIITLSLLISLLIAFLFVYGYELYRGMHQDRLSAAVHEQVNSIILSIVLAVAVILYYIRPEKSSGTASAMSKRPLLRKLAFCWIILNSLLVLSAALHNAAYVQRYGLTLLRVGVYIFLLLSLTGLYFTYRKIRQERTAGYLIGIMFKIFFGTIMLNSVINWSAIITRYNLAWMANPDLGYLRSLDYNMHIIYPYLEQTPKYRTDPKYQDNIRLELKDKLDWQNQEFLSAAWYYKYARWTLRIEK